MNPPITANSDITLNSGNGGLVVYPRLPADPPLAAGAKITIMRDMDFLQETQLVNAARFDPHVLEEQLDRLIADDQQLLEGLSRTLMVPPGEAAPSIGEFLAGMDEAVIRTEAAVSTSEQNATQAEGWSELSRKWAENPEDEEVADDGYSSFHWAEKSRQAALESLASQTASANSAAASEESRIASCECSDLAADSEAAALAYKNAAALSEKNAAAWAASVGQALSAAGSLANLWALLANYLKNQGIVEDYFFITMPDAEVEDYGLITDEATDVEDWGPLIQAE
jgi:hypothetical protein